MKLTIAVLLLCCFRVVAQSDSLRATCRLCDSIRFAGNLRSFYRQLDATIQSPTTTTVKIVQIGDSHVQMGHFSGGIAAELGKLSTSLTNASFRFPYVFTGGYTPPAFRIDTSGRWNGEKMVGSQTETRFALSGHALVLQGDRDHPGTLTFSLADSLSAIELLVETNKGWELVCDSAQRSVERISRDLAIVRFAFSGKRTHFRIGFHARKKHPRPLRIFGFREPSQQPGIRFESYGSSGGKYSDYAQKCDYCSEQLAYARPDLLIVSLGTNDAFGTYEGKSYYALVSGFIRRVRAENPQAAILLTTQPDTYFKEKRPVSDLIVHAALLQIAQENGCALWDLAAVMGGTDSMILWYAEGLASTDLLHFTQQGYTFQAQLLIEALVKGFEDYKAESLK